MPSTVSCPECGAVYSADGDSCTERFNALLALDHSRQQPWGSRHGEAFAAFALQHPLAFGRSIDGSWAALYRIHVAGDAQARVFERLRARPNEIPADWKLPTRPERPVALPAVTIADLGDFEATTYPDRLAAWCRAALAMWGANVADDP
jgi:hypothetical protein